MQHSTGPRETANLSESVHNRSNVYTIAVVAKTSSKISKGANDLCQSKKMST